MKTKVKAIRTIGLVGNADKPGAARTLRKAAALIARRNVKLRALAETARVARLSVPTDPDLASLRHAVDLLLVFGGDGTMLGVAREAAGSPTPILGVNIGGLGFLTAVPSAGLARALESLWRRDFRLETRTLLEATGRCHGRSVKLIALNDFVISRVNMSRLIELEVCADGELVTRFRCDGLIVSSPTGSTAYALAAGGAVVHPTARVLELTPISPHTLSNRPLILSSSAALQIRGCGPGASTVLSADGQRTTEVDEGDIIQVRQSRRSVRLVHLAGSSFFQALRHKLHWRGGSL